MSDPKPTELALLMDELLMLFHESALYHNQTSLREVLQEAQKSVTKLRRRVLKLSQRYVVAVVGLTNVGKSTLLSALLGAELTPRRNGPCTAAPIEFIYGKQLRVTSYHRAELARPSRQFDNATALHDYLSTLSEDLESKRSASVERVVVEAPLPLLAHGLIIADTPGFGEAQGLGPTRSDEGTLRDYLAQQASQVFWIVLAEQGIGQRELAFHQRYFAEVCDDLVVTGCDDWDERDRDRFRCRFTNVFSGLTPRFHFVSGLRGLEARRENNAHELEAAGITHLEQRIRDLHDHGQRLVNLTDALQRLSEDLVFWLNHHTVTQSLTHEGWWRPDSWGRWSSSLPHDGLKQSLTHTLKGNA
ncbi:MAG: hypothetical protein HC794_08035 [Nitrospiraceae bacterium]|nr:hypothetical protein [Nitrospiraceae bacterium]